MMTTNNINVLRYYYCHYYYYNNNYICIFNSLHLLLLLLITIIMVPLSSTTQSTTKYINNEGTTTTTITTRILFTPENIRYSFNRCQNDSNLNFDQILIWMPWRLSSLLNGDKHNDINVNCLIKCILMKLGLINLKHRGLDDEKFLNQILSRGFQHNNNNNNIDEMMILVDDNDNNNRHDNELESLLKGPLDGTCQSYHNKWIELIENYGQIIRKSFYGYKNDIIKFYQSDNDNNDKNIGETSIEFCNKKILFNYNKNLPQINLNMHSFSIILMNNIYKCYLKCIFVHFHYFDAYGRVDISEVIRSVQESGFMNSYNLRKIYICVHTANQLFLQGLCNVAYELYSCLSLNIYGAKNIITYRNELTRYY